MIQHTNAIAVGVVAEVSRGVEWRIADRRRLLLVEVVVRAAVGIVIGRVVVQVGVAMVDVKICVIIIIVARLELLCDW